MNSFVKVNDPGQGLVERSYRLHVPLNYDIDVAVPLVMDFHGWTMWAEQMEEYSKFSGKNKLFILI